MVLFVEIHIYLIKVKYLFKGYNRLYFSIVESYVGRSTLVESVL